jgi:hypothetical protein
LEIVLDSVLEGLFGTVITGVLGSASKVDAVCALPLGDMKWRLLTQWPMIVIGDCADDMEHLPPPNVAVDPAESS